MKAFPRLVSCVAMALVVGAGARGAGGEKLPAEEFARGPAIQHAVLSRDGKFVAYVITFEKEERLVFRNLETDKVQGIIYPPETSPLELGYTGFFWVGKDRAAFSLYTDGLSAMDVTGRNFVGIAGRDRQTSQPEQQYTILNGVIHTFAGENDGKVLMGEYDIPIGLADAQFFSLTHPNVAKVDTRTGRSSRVVVNPGDVAYWLADGSGFVCIGVQQSKGLNRIIHRQSEADSWLPLPELDYNGRRTVPLGVSGDGHTLYLSRITPAGTWGVYAYDLVKKQVGDLILGHELYDIIPPNWNLGYDNFSLQSLVMSPDKQELLGIRYVTDLPHVLWLAPNMADAQAALDQSLPNVVNTITSMSDDRQKFLVLSWAANDPGTYYILDLKKKSLKPFLARAPWIKPAQMAKVIPISYKARDGLLIHGYLTIPPGREPEHLPLVVYPHGGPWARDAWEFDGTAQFLANRGYAVLQVNYRGSVGFGDAFYKKGIRKVGHEIQNDIEDGARWAIANGITAPKRMAIMGGSYGGYSALMGLIQTPDLYTCGVSLAGVTDWGALIERNRAMFPIAAGIQAHLVGDPAKQAADLRDVSPIAHVGRIQVPVLIVHGKDDQNVPYAQATALVAELEKEKKPYEFMARANELHGFRNARNQAEYFRRVEAFLAKYLSVEAPAGGLPSK